MTTSDVPASDESTGLPLTAQGRVDGRSARKVETRRRIIAAASELFAEQGYTGTSMDEIAEAAGVSKGTIFYNFRNKSDLFEQLIRHAVGVIADEMTRAREGRHGWEALSESIWRVLVAVEDSPAAAQIVITEIFRTQRPWASSLVESREVLVAPLAQIIEEVAEDRRLAHGERALPAEHVPNVAMSILGALVVATLDHRAFQPERSLHEVHGGLMLAISGMQV